LVVIHGLPTNDHQCPPMPMDAHEYRETEVLLSPSGLLSQVDSLVTRRTNVTRQSLRRWQLQLNLDEAPYTLSDAEAIAYYADLLACRTRPKRAKELTLNYLRSK
jgi:hypothetical protein